ncbi:glycoside hydrolase family 2 TIM barrel-domain containing protein [Flavivirga abyssicola]|uniref:glycoside hydrolase family 2 TIM barrel-domain containing protein n=1 Tax=Flavivirga abyssicola TaxID=3063533 RepID=UPI0026DEC24A|nr:glycoside hydrolase family 2 TIM barrel-domain containing protein [Flavivirga sp. MEBiC07777]WVK11993.1 glycoside hydrolase family 2 TIM barrel-domain containing protein [Flavivirga sp. MEBiC07777]
MKKAIQILFIAILAYCCNSNTFDNHSKNKDFNSDWNFYLSQEDLDVKKITASKFKNINLPHDWVIENEFDSTLAKDALATGYLKSKGYGYYKKTFDTEPNNKNVVYLHFDGVYNNSEIWLNNKKLGFHPYGYSPFYFNISKHLNQNGKNNEVIVKIDHSRYADSRWYTGAGIYRKVDLISLNKVHIPIWGTFITTPKVSKTNATIQLDITVQNDLSTESNIKVKTVIIDNNNVEIKSTSTNSNIKENSTNQITQTIQVENPKLWNTTTPNLYKAITSIIKDNETLDTYETTFGIRSIKFDANKGFFLNGENMKIKGVCLHHDGGLVGAAVPKGVWKRRLQTLKDGGCNAVRISHNPASSEFLDLCDEMGIMVQDEFFDEWDNPKDKRHNKGESKSTDYITRGYGEHFQKWAETDLKNTVRSHRNHPSIIQWSIGNEIEWTYPKNAAATGFFNNMEWSGNYFWSEPPYTTEKIKEQLDAIPSGKYDIGRTAQKLSKWTKELDTTRPITANCILPSASHLSGYTDALDVVGYSYRRVLYDYGHENYPDKPIMGTENLGQYHEWKAVMERPFISGTFLWTGIDYMGEIRDPWPVRVQPSGLLNSAGFPRGSYHMMKTLWHDEPHIKIATQNIEKSLYIINDKKQIVAKDPEKWKRALWEWQDENDHWNYNLNDMIAVAIYSNCEEIELFLNDKSLGKRTLSEFEDHIYKWGVPFTDGKLVAKGIKDGTEITSEIITARKATKIKLSSKEIKLKANNNDVSHIIAQLIDDKGNPVKTDNKEIAFEIKGNAKLLGVDSGWIKSVEKFQSNKSTTHNGKTLLIIQTTDKVGDVQIIAKSKGLEDASLQIQVE